MLEYSREFIVLADCLNYVKAARELNVSQPSLTRHIAYLEKELGFRLFNRNPLSLTPAGQFYLEFIGEIIERLDEGIEQGRSIASGNQTSLTIFMFPGNSTFATVVHKTIAAIREELPLFSPHVQFENRHYSTPEALVAGVADVGIIYESSEELPDELACEHLCEAPATIWAHKDNPLLRSGVRTLHDLSECYLVKSTSRLSQAWFDGMVHLFRTAGIEPKFRLRELENRESFFFNQRVDEILISGTDDDMSRFNPHLVPTTLEEPLPAFAVQILYRRNAPALTQRFISIAHRVAQTRSTN